MPECDLWIQVTGSAKPNDTWYGEELTGRTFHAVWETENFYVVENGPHDHSLIRKIDCKPVDVND